MPRYPNVLRQLAQVVAESQISSGDDQLDDKTRQVVKEHFPQTSRHQLLRLLVDGARAREKLPQPLRVAVCLSGGPAPGGHNVIWGILDGIRQLHHESVLIGFQGGIAGLLQDHAISIDETVMAEYRNSGGFDLLGSGRTKIESPAQIERCAAVMAHHKLDGLVIVGGDDSNSNAAVLAEALAARAPERVVVGVPKTIDGDLKNRFVELSFGFDTAVRVYGEMISHIARDALSAGKHYHVIRLMGRAASHITLEAALQTHPNLALISEEIERRGWSLQQIVEHICQVVCQRAALGKHYGVILIPEGLIEFIPEMGMLIGELNQLIGEFAPYYNELDGYTEKAAFVNLKLSRDASYTFSQLPIDIQRQLLLERDPHGNVVVSQIETEKLIMGLVKVRLSELAAAGSYNGRFSLQRHFLGYEGRCAAPTNFDASYAYCLGATAACLVNLRANGYMSVVRNLAMPVERWEPVGVPLVSMMALEPRQGRLQPVIRKGLVSLEGKAFARFAASRDGWALNDHYRFTGPIQYFGPDTVCYQIPEILLSEEMTS